MDSEKTNDKVWHYLHGLLSAADRSAFESRLECDPQLRTQLAEARQLDDTLKSVAPYANWSEEQLASRVLDAWEQDRRQTVAVPRLFATGLRAWTRPSPVAKLGLAAALCLLLAATSFHLASGFTTWSRPVINLPAYRGISTAADTQAQQAEMADLARQFEDNLEHAYRSVLGEQAAWWSLRPRQEWRMGLQIQSFHQGVLSVHVQAEHRKHKDLKLEWTEYFSDPGAFKTSQENMSATIAGALAAAAPR